MEGVKEGSDINSPFREFYNTAEYVARGFNDGISAMTASFHSTVQK